MRRIELPKLMHIDPEDPRRLYANAAALMAAAWHRAFAYNPKRRRLVFNK